jgi:hypothetical protein
MGRAIVAAHIGACTPLSDRPPGQPCIAWARPWPTSAASPARAAPCQHGMRGAPGSAGCTATFGATSSWCTSTSATSRPPSSRCSCSAPRTAWAASGSCSRAGRASARGPTTSPGSSSSRPRPASATAATATRAPCARRPRGHPGNYKGPPGLVASYFFTPSMCRVHSMGVACHPARPPIGCGCHHITLRLLCSHSASGQVRRLDAWASAPADGNAPRPRDMGGRTLRRPAATSSSSTRASTCCPTWASTRPRPAGARPAPPHAPAADAARVAQVRAQAPAIQCMPWTQACQARLCTPAGCFGERVGA